MAQAKIDGLTCDNCPTNIAVDEFDLRNKGLPEGWLRLTRDIHLCPACVVGLRAALAPPTNGKVSAIDSINRRRATVPTATVRPSRVAIAIPRRG